LRICGDYIVHSGVQVVAPEVLVNLPRDRIDACGTRIVRHDIRGFLRKPLIPELP
jgi:hypothetical protein